jgi:hypothetical protein
MEYINVVMAVLAVFMAKHNLNTDRPQWAMLWSALFGWNLHIVLTDLLV